MSEVQFMLDWLKDNEINPDDYFHNMLPYYNPSEVIFLSRDEVKTAMDGGNKAINKLCERFFLTKKYVKPSNSNIRGSIKLYPKSLEDIETEFKDKKYSKPSFINSIFNTRIAELKKPRMHWDVFSSQKNLKKALSGMENTDYSITYVWGRWFIKKINHVINKRFELSEDFKQVLLNPLVDETRIIPEWYVVNSKKVVVDVGLEA
ncbi:MAG: hypothetical protein ISP01_05500 [Methanobrevibacter arboriphilus]|uniref:Uncharacterized protein n=1 Tax=Methanobrevibacter arboriphilus TaxID=39441 RepID=A0A843ADQ6_METAZ|nr:hypothetical protein [Methanobrevibacter arboriphilus]MBF4468844.1 hypothetical protein [Methanobrevibacter arboriphilus]